MPAPLDPDDERGVPGPSGPDHDRGVPGPSGPDEVVVLVEGRGAAAARRPPLRRRPERHEPAAGPPAAPRRAASPRLPMRPLAAGRGPGVDAASPVPAPGPPVAPAGRPPKPPKPPKTPKPPKRRPEGSFLRRHFRVPGPLGLVIVVLALAMGTGFFGAYIWAGNDARNIRSSPEPLTPPRAAESPGDAEVTTTTKPDLSADTLIERLGPSVWSVRTFDSAGQPVQGSAWLTRSAGGQSLLLTSFAVVEASAHQPAPDITVSGSGFNGKAQLFTWDEPHDLALLVVDGTKTPALPWVADSANPKAGDKVFALGADAKLKPGLITAVSDQAVEHNVFIDDALRGGPIVNVKGEVIAVSSAVYTAGGVATDTAFFGVPIRASCSAVLSCSGAFAGPGGEVASTPSTPESTITTTEPA